MIHEPVMMIRYNDIAKNFLFVRLGSILGANIRKNDAIGWWDILIYCEHAAIEGSSFQTQAVAEKTLTDLALICASPSESVYLMDELGIRVISPIRLEDAK